MTLVALVLGAALATLCVLYVAYPFLREPEPEDDRLDEPGELERRRLALAEERDRTLAALKELEFDHRTGTISDEDYRALVGPLRRQAAEALRALEPRSDTMRPFALPAREGRGSKREGGREMVEVPGQPLPPEPYPSPGEGDPPEQPSVPEPYPPPGEAEPPDPPLVPQPYPDSAVRDRR